MSEHPSAVDRLGLIQGRIDTAARGAGREPGSVCLIAVSKTFGAEAIEPVLRAGHRDFGENKVQEASSKWPGLKLTYSGVRLHLIGGLQTNKAREAVTLFDVIHSVDRERLAEALRLAIDREGRTPDLFVQVNTGGEAQKGGVAPEAAADFVEACRTQFGLSIAGLMCIPPEGDAPAPHFALVRQIGRDCGLNQFSMGMSSDFETAIRLGATHVRVGSAIFGARVHA